VGQEHGAVRGHQGPKPPPPADPTRRRLDLAERVVHDRVEDRRLVREVRVERVRHHAELARKPSHRQVGDITGGDEAAGGDHHRFLRQAWGAAGLASCLGSHAQ
jgi:hypothetical protein